MIAETMESSNEMAGSPMPETCSTAQKELYAEAMQGPNMYAKMAYLCGPIDGVSYEDAADWRKDAKDLLSERAVGVFDPHLAFMNSGHAYSLAAIAEIDLLAVRLSDLVLVNLGLAIRASSKGTWLEMGYAIAHGIPVYAFSPYLKTGGPTFISGLPKVQEFLTLERAVKIICRDFFR